MLVSKACCTFSRDTNMYWDKTNLEKNKHKGITYLLQFLECLVISQFISLSVQNDHLYSIAHKEHIMKIFSNFEILVIIYVILNCNFLKKGAHANIVAIKVNMENICSAITKQKRVLWPLKKS